MKRQFATLGDIEQCPPELHPLIASHMDIQTIVLFSRASKECYRLLIEEVDLYGIILRVLSRKSRVFTTAEEFGDLVTHELRDRDGMLAEHKKLTIDHIYNHFYRGRLSVGPFTGDAIAFNKLALITLKLVSYGERYSANNIVEPLQLLSNIEMRHYGVRQGLLFDTARLCMITSHRVIVLTYDTTTYKAVSVSPRSEMIASRVPQKGGEETVVLCLYHDLMHPKHSAMDRLSYMDNQLRFWRHRRKVAHEVMPCFRRALEYVRDQVNEKKLRK